MIEIKRYKTGIKRYFFAYVTGGLQETPAAFDFERRAQKSIQNSWAETHRAAPGVAR
jgi:hypothetical protein